MTLEPADNDPLAKAARLSAADLPPGSVKRVQVAGQPVAVCNVDGSYYAIHDTCTHADASLTDGDLEGHELICPLHAAAFDVRTGQPLYGPADVPCRPYDVQQEGDTLIITRRLPGVHHPAAQD